MKSNSRTRTTSLYLSLNKQGVKATKRLIAVASGQDKSTVETVAANESILRLLLQYDPVLMSIVNEGRRLETLIQASHDDVSNGQERV